MTCKWLQWLEVPDWGDGVQCSQVCRVVVLNSGSHKPIIITGTWGMVYSLKTQFDAHCPESWLLIPKHTQQLRPRALGCCRDAVWAGAYSIQQ